ncbi:hypothetical protein LTR05_005510 [Lithohypha guttulata]|uniref:Uncharacterized protein n=1 Tax=Lithohypha guttulata TaxID=1690604 RepID=A0AAN7YA29_9EURO|nr:hypothetical protein LTR05_005510 [Lithohypha guttulata]
MSTAQLFRRIVLRPTGLPLRTPTAAIPSFSRSYASGEPGTTTKGDAQNASQGLGTPSPKGSDSPQEGDVKSARANEGRSQEQGGSVAQPISGANQSTQEAGQDEEGTETIKQDPNKPAEQKKEQTLKQGDTPMDPGQTNQQSSGQFSQKMQQ